MNDIDYLRDHPSPKSGAKSNRSFTEFFRNLHEQKTASDKLLPIEQKIDPSLLGAFVGEEELALAREGGACERAALKRRFSR